MMIMRPEFWQELMIPAFVATFQMTAISAVVGTVLGIAIAVLLVITGKNGIMENRYVYGALSFVVNIVRSFPFIILIIFLVPVTKLIVGTSIGVAGAIVPLVIASTAFIAKVVENALQEVDKGLIEALKSFGLNKRQIIFKVMFAEAVPAIVSGVVLATIAILNCTAMAGAVGAGGIGSIAIIFGYQSFRKDVMYVTVIILIILVQLIQSLGDYIYRKMKH